MLAQLRRTTIALAVAVATITIGATAATAQAHPGLALHSPGTGPGRGLTGGPHLFTPPADRDGVRQILGLLRHGDLRDARRLTQMVTTPQSVWLDGGTPADVGRAVRSTMRAAALTHTVPVFVAYDIPARDCGQYSGGGATDTASYLAWIDGLAAALGSAKAVVLLEPDGLGIIPYNTDLNGTAEWCRPDLSGTGMTPLEANQARYDQLNAAVDRLEQQPGTGVYLDGTHSAWLGVGDIADRLTKAGVQRAQGFFLNVSNYQLDPQLTEYGTWVSGCIAFANNPDDGGWRLGHHDYCASQYYSGAAPNDGQPGNAVSPTDFSTWHWTDLWYQQNLGDATPTTHFVVDTSRNGTGPNDMSRYALPPYNQPAAVVSTLAAGSWCNPPGAGLGIRPRSQTGVPLLDANLWVKIPGQSDGSCDIAGGARAWDYGAYNPWGLTGDAQSTFDPLWGQTDPAAGDWFADQAAELARLANPRL
jgi:endoglucanase